MSTEPLFSPSNNSLDLTGLEDLLERAQLEVVTSAPDAEAEIVSESQDIDEPSEARMILDLMGHLMQVNDLVIESNRRLNLATARLSKLDEMLTAQSIWLERLPALEVKAVQLEDVQLRLETAIAENERLKRNWINKFLSALKEKA